MSDSLFNTILASQGPSQSKRLMSLHTPLGADVLLAERMHCEESIGPGNFLTLPEVDELGLGDAGSAKALRKAALQDITGYRLWMTALSTNAHLELSELLGKPVRLDWQTDSATPRSVHGRVTRFELLGSDGGLARYALRIEPGLRMLKLQTDSWIFQDQSVIEIVDEVLGEQASAWGIKWRWMLADESVYPRRSLCTQFEETTLQFVCRLLAEEGLFFWFEHQSGQDLGQHTLVIGDEAALLLAHPQGSIRFTQSGAAVFKNDSLNRVETSVRWVPTRLIYGSWDYRRASMVESEVSLAVPGCEDELAYHDVPGVYAFESPAQAQRIAQRHLESMQLPGQLTHAQGIWRAAQLATRWKLADHPWVPADTEQITLGMRQLGRNNITAEQHTALTQRLGHLPALFLSSFDAALDAQGKGADKGGKKGNDKAKEKASLLPNQTEAPLFETHLVLQEASIALRAPLRGCVGPDTLYDRPRARGVQTAVVVGSPDPIYTDRDNRVRVQFHWQRGARSSHRLTHPEGSNAPGTAGAGTWVRVMQSTASVNSGEVFTPRKGQEVIISFHEEDIDRPILIGAAYCGRGQEDAQGNLKATGPSGATGNAAAWFPGGEGGHAHGAVLSGFKTQSMEASQVGMGGYSQLVFDDTPGQSRAMLGTTHLSAGAPSNWLNMGHLLHQVDNQRLAPRGQGWELISTGQGALRAGSGLLLSTFAKPGGTTQASAHSMEAEHATQTLAGAKQLTQTLTDTAQQHAASLPAVDVKTAKISADPEAASASLPVVVQQDAQLNSLQATDARGHGEQGGAGTTPSWSRPELVLSAAALAINTPAHSVYASGDTTSLTAQQDINLTAQRNFCIAVTNGISLFTYGQAPSGGSGKPNTEEGLQLHAASGQVSFRINSNQASFKAKNNVLVQSTQADLVMSAPRHLLFTAGGSALKIEPGKITITTMRQAVFKAAQRVFTGPSPADGDASLTTAKDIPGCGTFSEYPPLGAQATALLD